MAVDVVLGSAPAQPGDDVTALLTALEWQALFPSRRDCLALASLPVSAA